MKLALFDFDETLIKENSLSYLFKAVTGKPFLFPQAITLALKPATYKNGIKYSIKRRLYARCLAGISEQTLLAAGKTVAAKLHPLSKVVRCLHELHIQGCTIWIVTATPTAFIQGVVNEWLWPVARVIGTQLYQRDGVYTGKFGEECMREEKVTRLNAVFTAEKLQPHIAVAYGNLPVDIPMMSLAATSYAVAGEQIFIFNQEKTNGG